MTTGQQGKSRQAGKNTAAQKATARKATTQKATAQRTSAQKKTASSPAPRTARRGSLVIAGTGIMAAAHCSLEAVNAIQAADVVFVAIPDPLALNWLRPLHHDIRPLDDLYHSCDNRLATYEAMAARIMDAVRSGLDVCAVFYGHPGVFVLPSHLALEQALAEGYPAQMLPGISAADCLFADLAVDPSHPGCQMYEASAFLFWKYRISPHAALILWQVGVVGDHTFRLRSPSHNGLQVLADELLKDYPPAHRVCLYEATRNPLLPPRRDWLALADLPAADVNGYTTLYVPPYGLAPTQTGVLRKLGLRRADIADIE